MLIDDFLRYESDLARSFLIPLLESMKISLSGKSILDVGCGYGGVLAALEERFGLSRSLGIEVDSEMVKMGLARNTTKIQLEVQNFFSLEGVTFDFILMRDVLEHIVDVERALSHARSLLNPGGMLYVSFAPFYSPFGGHQHNGAGFFSNVPWLQFLPESWFRSFLKLKGNSYKSLTGLEVDMNTVLRTRLTLKGFHSYVLKLNLEPHFFTQFLIRPDYKIKFGLPAVRFPRFPWLEELFCTGAEAILIPKSPG